MSPYAAPVVRRALTALFLALAACATLRGGIATAARVWDVTDERFTRWTDQEADAIVDLRTSGLIAEADRRRERLASLTVRWDGISRDVDIALQASEANDAWEATKVGLAVLREVGAVKR